MVDPLADLAQVSSTLYVSKANDGAYRCAVGVIQELGVPYTLHERDVLATSCSASMLQQLCLTWSRRMTRNQLRSIRCRLMKANHRPTPGQLMESYEMLQLVNAIEGRWLQTVLEAERLVTYFQPIVMTQTPGDVYAYECLVRARETSGEIITPDRLFKAARATGDGREIGPRIADYRDLDGPSSTVGDMHFHQLQPTIS